LQVFVFDPETAVFQDNRDRAEFVVGRRMFAGASRPAVPTEDGYPIVAGSGRRLSRCGRASSARLGFGRKLSSNLTIRVSERQNDLDSDVAQATGSESIMIKYCFALTNPRRPETRLRVGEFPSAESAFQLAELIASELSIEADGNWWGWTVEVRSVAGRKLLAVPVAGAEAQQAPETVSGSAVPAMIS
jgi:hypothetical protein